MKAHATLFNRPGRAAALAMLLLTLGSVAAAETRWVTDQLEITMRTGQSTGHSITRVLPSGTAVELLESNDETGYSRVRSPDGSEGWVLTRLLMNERAAREQLASMRQRLENLQQERRELNQRIATLEGEKRTLEQERAALTGRAGDLDTELANIRQVSANALSIAEENNSLRSRMAETRNQIDALKLENTVLKDRADQRWFLIGVGVLTLGIILGLILPRLRVKRKSRWGSL